MTTDSTPATERKPDEQELRLLGEMFNGARIWQTAGDVEHAWGGVRLHGAVSLRFANGTIGTCWNSGWIDVFNADESPVPLRLTLKGKRVYMGSERAGGDIA